MHIQHSAGPHWHLKAALRQDNNLGPEPNSEAAWTASGSCLPLLFLFATPWEDGTTFPYSTELEKDREEKSFWHRIVSVLMWTLLWILDLAKLILKTKHLKLQIIYSDSLQVNNSIIAPHLVGLWSIKLVKSPAWINVKKSLIIGHKTVTCSCQDALWLYCVKLLKSPETDFKPPSASLTSNERISSHHFIFFFFSVHPSTFSSSTNSLLVFPSLLWLWLCSRSRSTRCIQSTTCTPFHMQQRADEACARAI